MWTRRRFLETAAGLPLVGSWMMQPGEDKVVARRLREVLEMTPLKSSRTA